MIVAATQIRVSGIAGLIRFLIFSQRALKQLKQADGLVFARVRGFRTLSGWENQDVMSAFRNTGAHLSAMQSTKRIGSVKSVTWEADIEPDWKEAHRRLNPIPWRS